MLTTSSKHQYPLDKTSRSSSSLSIWATILCSFLITIQPAHCLSSIQQQKQSQQTSSRLLSMTSQPQPNLQPRPQPYSPYEEAGAEIDEEKEKSTFNLTREQLISIAELNTLGKTNPGKDQMDRLSRIESAIFSSAYDGYSREVETRLSQIFLEAPPSDEIMLAVQQKATKYPQWFNKSATLDWTNSLVQRTALLELLMYQKISPKENLLSRLARLEKDTFGKDFQAPDKTNLDSRVHKLIETLGPPEDLIEDVISASSRKLDWFLNPVPLSWVSPLSQAAQGAKSKFGKYSRETATGLARILTSPTLWQILIAGGLIYGAIELNRHGALPVYSTPEHGCTGPGLCTICSSCNYCRHCNNGGIPCSVYYRYH